MGLTNAIARHATLVALGGDGWYATCSCGWGGNNPYDDEQAASDGAVYHGKTGPLEDTRAAAVAAYAAATNPEERTAAIEAYEKAGK